MAKYTINDTTLVAIADAIRAKSGNTGGIDPANMAALIAAIEAGGGSGGNGPFTTWGTYTPTEDMDKVDVEIDLGIAYDESSYFNEPRAFLLWRNGSHELVNGSYEVLLNRSNTTGFTYTYGTRPSGVIYNANTSNTMTAKIEVKNGGLVAIVKGGTTANYVYGLKAGVEYIWAFVYPIGGT